MKTKCSVSNEGHTSLSSFMCYCPSLLHYILGYKRQAIHLTETFIYLKHAQMNWEFKPFGANMSEAVDGAIKAIIAGQNGFSLC